MEEIWETNLIVGKNQVIQLAFLMPTILENSLLSKCSLEKLAKTPLMLAGTIKA